MGRKQREREAGQGVMSRPAHPLWPALAPPMRYLAGLGLLGFCIWLPAMIALFRA